jgi:hypothetical protein
MAQSQHAPEFLVCLNCETPCYVFEFEDGKVTEAFCAACGNDEPEMFASEDELDAMTGDAEQAP